MCRHRPILIFLLQVVGGGWVALLPCLRTNSESIWKAILPYTQSYLDPQHSPPRASGRPAAENHFDTTALDTAIRNHSGIGIFFRILEDGNDCAPSATSRTTCAFHIGWDNYSQPKGCSGIFSLRRLVFRKILQKLFCQEPAA